MTAPWPADFEAIVRSYLPLLADAPLVPDLVLSRFGLDSLTNVTLLLELEDRFEVTIPDETLGSVSTISAGDLWNAVAAQRSDAVADR